MGLRLFINSNGLPGIASATMYEGAKDMSYCDTQLRVVFDGDAVLFCEEPEHSTKDHGLDKCFQHEALADNKPLGQVGSVKAALFRSTYFPTYRCRNHPLITSRPDSLLLRTHGIIRDPLG